MLPRPRDHLASEFATSVDIGIGQHRLSGLDVVIGEFRRPSSGAAKPAGCCEARLGALADQAALEFC
jgi:hypothetical protein